MDAIDNPSYFSLPVEAHKKSRNILRKWADSKNSATLPASSERKTTLSGSRRNFKSLIRANSEDAQLLVLGKPRPSDLAPSIYLNRQQRHRSTGNVIGSNDLLHQDMVHCGGVADDDGDVFLSNNANVQYYNTSTLPVKRILTSARRRHSIGSFLNRDRSFLTNTDTDTRSRETSIRRKFKHINIDKVVKMEDELDILLVSCGDSEAATLWVNYLISCFQHISEDRNKPPFKLRNVKIEDILIPLIGSGCTEKCPEARLQIVVICPMFLQKIQTIPETETSLGRVFHPDKVVAMMLGVQDHSENDHIKTVIPNYEHWRKMTVKDQDSTFVGDFLGVAMDILTKSWQIQEAANSEQQRTYFSVLPKKVKMGQNKLIVLLSEPLLSDDIVKVSIDKGGGQHVDIAMVKRRNPYTLQFTMPVNCLQISTLVNVIVEKNGKPLGKRMVKCESRMRELDQILRSLDNPVHFMCQCFGLNSSDREQLDTFLLSVFQKNLPPNFNLLNPCIPINKSFACNEEFPTLLHFTAKYGLEKLSWQLLESPGGEQACQIRNSSHLTPAEIAERANHSKLANVLKNYMHMTELSSVYSYLKGMTDKHKCLPESNYILPRSLKDIYTIPPAARPVNPLAGPMPVSDTSSSNFPYYTNFKPVNFSIPSSSPTSVTSSTTSFSPFGMENYDIPRNGRPCTPFSPHTPPTPSSPVERKFEGYLEMNSTGNESCHFGSVSSFSTNADFPEHYGSFGKLDGCDSVSSPTESHAPSSKYGSANHLSSREKLSPDDELLEIINDFKNHVFTIAEVEALVESWQNRNDVQQSFKDKQEQLNKMREEYDRIQKRMKDQMKRTTPFERIRKFFSRGKSKHLEVSEKRGINSDVAHMNIPQARPTSNISLQSSSSTSSAANSVSSGSGVTVDIANVHKYLEKPASPPEKLNASRKNHNCAEMPHPPKFLDLTSNPDFSEYVQPDCVACTTKNRLSSCSSSVVNDTIHECVEVDVTETSTSVNRKVEDCTRLETYHFSMMKNDKINEKHKTNSLRLELKNKSKNIKNKVKSAENLIHDSEFTNTDCNKNHLCEQSQIQIVDCDKKKEEISKTSMDELSACQALCAEAIKCLSAMTSESQNDEVSSEIHFQFNRIGDTAGSSTQSECGSVDSRHNSSLDLSSLSLNSNCTVDEDGEIKCSLELKITEEGEIETENAPPPASPSAIQRVNICNLPEYVNVNIQNTSYTVVSS